MSDSTNAPVAQLDRASDFESEPNSNDLAPMAGHMPTGRPRPDAVFEVCGSCGGSGQRCHPVLTRLLDEAKPGSEWYSTAALAQAAEVSETHAVTLLHRLVDKGRMARRPRGGRGGGFEWRALRRIRVEGAAMTTPTDPKSDTPTEAGPEPELLPGLVCDQCRAWARSYVDAAVGALLAERDELRAEVERLRENYDAEREISAEWEAEVERLREQLAEVDAWIAWQQRGFPIDVPPECPARVCDDAIARNQARQESNEDD